MWPDDRDLPVEVQAAFGADLTADPGTWSWTDLSSRLRADPIRLRAGRSSGARSVSPGTCTAKLVNDDGALTPLHPMSPYWPDVELGTPLRIRLRRAEDAFDRTVSSGWGAADSGQTWTGSGGSASDYSVAAGVARHSHSTGNTYRRTVLDVDLVDVEQLVDVSTPVLLTGAALVTGVLARYTDANNYYWLRAEMNAGGTSIQLKISRRVGGSETQLANVNPLPGVTYAANVPLRVRASVVGTRLAIKVWTASGAEPAGWQLTTTDSSLTSPGATGMQTWVVGGNTNTLPLAVQFRNYSLRVDRFAGYADQWQPTYLPVAPGESVSAVQITASGLLRRLGQGEPPSWSAMRRAITSAEYTGLLAYWPCEDEPDSTQAASGLPDGVPLTAIGAVEFGALDPAQSAGGTYRYGTSALPDISDGGGLIGGQAPAGVSSPVAWTVQWASREASGTSAPAPFVLLSWQAGGLWEVVLTGPPNYNTVLRVDGVVRIEDDTSFFGFYEWRVVAQQSGGNITAQLLIDGSTQGDITPGGGGPWTATWAGTLGWPTGVAVNPSRAASAPAQHLIGHIQVWDGSAPQFRGNRTDVYGRATNGPWDAWGYEAATERLRRLTAEDGVTLDMPTPDESTVFRMGPQDEGASLELYRESEVVDGGILYESGYGLAYLPRDDRYNATPAMTVDLATYRVSGTAEPLTPTYDDQAVRNEWTVDRPGGSSVTVADRDHQRRGVYSDSASLNLYLDEDLAEQAAWRVHLGTVVDLREDKFPIDLAANPDLVDAWLSCRVGSRIVRTNPPSQHRPGDLDRLVEGWTESLGPRVWQVTVNPSPAEPWDVATVDGSQRVGADGSTLAADLSASGMTLSLASTTANGPWTTAAADFPLDIRVGGERITLSAITGASSPQTATISARGVNGVQRAWPAGTEVDVWQPGITAL